MTARGRSALRDGLVLLALAAYAVPYFWQALTSVKPEAELMVLPPVLPSRLTFEHYRVVFERSVMVRALVNSLGVGLITTAVAISLGLAAAYGFARFPVPGKPGTWRPAWTLATFHVGETTSTAPPRTVTRVSNGS